MPLDTVSINPKFTLIIFVNNVSNANLFTYILIEIIEIQLQTIITNVCNKRRVCE